jgi:hypothetical protein
MKIPAEGPAVGRIFLVSGIGIAILINESVAEPVILSGAIVYAPAVASDANAESSSPHT